MLVRRSTRPGGKPLQARVKREKTTARPVKIYKTPRAAPDCGLRAREDRRRVWNLLPQRGCRRNCGKENRHA